MSGHFHKIVGKTINGIYCRENSITPMGQVFITFDDGTYFELYAMSNEIQGIKGLMSGDLDDVVALNHPEGREICRYPESKEVMMWIPPLNMRPENRMVYGVPSDKEIDNKKDYTDKLFEQVQNLINQLPEAEAASLIEEYLEDGGLIIDYHDMHEWGSEILTREEFGQLGVLYDMAFESISEEGYQGLMLVPKEMVSLEKFLQVAQVEFEVADDRFKLSDDDKYLVSKVDEIVSFSLKSCDLNPREIVSCGRMLHVLRRLPVITPGAFLSISFTVPDIPSLFLEFQVTEERLTLRLGGTDTGDAHYYIDWYIDIDGSRSDENNDSDIYYLEDNPFYRKNAIIEVSINDESNFVIN